MTKISNTEQEKAISHIHGTSLIIAGAGTGKTYVITEKIKKIIKEDKASPENILALTFTEKSAQEMEDRVDRALPYGFYQTWILTFHAFADILLHEYGLHIGISPSFKVMTTVDAISFIRRNLHLFEIEYFYSTGNPHGFINLALSHFSRLRDENITTKTYMQYAKILLAKAVSEEEKQEAKQYYELANMYSKYEELKKKANVFDFSDLVFYLVKLLNKRPNIKAIIQKRFKYAFVDEFQDTNIVQYDLIKTLFPPDKYPNLTVIGDDNQSIYKFRGASISNIMQFRTDYKKSTLYVLNVNYRSKQEILDAAYSLIQHNNPDTLEVQLGISKKLIADKGLEGSIKLLHAGSSVEEAESVASEIMSLVEEGYKYNDISILVRANEYAAVFMQEFDKRQIPYQFLGPSLLYYKTEIRNLIALLRFISDLNDSASLYRIFTMPIFKIPAKDMIYISSFAKKISRSLFEAIDILIKLNSGINFTGAGQYKQKAPIIKQEVVDKLSQLHSLLSLLVKQSSVLGAPSILYAFLKKSGYLQLFSNITSERQQNELENITSFFSKIKDMESLNGEVSVQDVVSSINLSLEMGESPNAQDYDFERENAVNILTVHSAKGLEFPVVFLVSCVSERFPSRFRSEKFPIPEALIKETVSKKNFHISEERRLFYVGLTRAKDRLYITYADFYGNAKRKRKPSPFIIEALGEKIVQKVLNKKTPKQLQIFNLNKKNNDLDKNISDNKSRHIIKNFSYSQISTYDECSLKYKYKYIIHIPEPDSAALSFGSSIHKALELFYKDIKAGQALNEKKLIKYFSENFIPFGYISDSQRRKTYLHGKKILSQYIKVFHKEHGDPISIERKFRLNIQGKSKLHTIVGKIDRIDKHKDFYEIIDYKTGRMPKQSSLKKTLQLGIYTLAVLDKSILGVPLDKVKLTYYFLDAGKKFSIKAADRDLDKLKQDIALTIDNMVEGDFLPNRGYHCRWCPFKIICPAWNQ